MKKFLKKLWSNRPFRTFMQGFVGVLSGGYFLGMNIDGLKALVISAIMAGLSAVMSLNTGDK